MGYSVEAYQDRVLEDAKRQVAAVTCQLLENDDNPVSAIGALIYGGLGTSCLKLLGDQELLDLCLVLETFVSDTRAIVAGADMESLL